MKKLIILLGMFCILLSGCGSKKTSDNLLDTIRNRGKIIVGVKDDSKPFGFYKNNELQGFDIDIARQIGHELLMTADTGAIELVPLTSNERIIALNSGRVDILVATLSINERRKEIIDFSASYYTAGQALMVPAFSKITSIEQLNDKKVAVVLGTTGEKTIRLLAPNATSIGARTYQEAFEYLKTGQVSAILADDSLLYGLLTPGYKILPQRYTKEYYAVGLRKGEENLSLLRGINSALSRIQETGRLEKIKRKWIPMAKIR